MTVTRGLVIAEPWIGHILAGRKDWEMRARPTSVRGWIGLIRKGSGTVVGLARLIGCGQALDQTSMIASIDRHRIPEDMIRRGEVAKWTVPWKLADAIPLAQPVPYEHKVGAVTWVSLSPEVGHQLAAYLDRGQIEAEIPLAPSARTNDYLAQISAASGDKPVLEQRYPERQTSMPSLTEGDCKVLGRSVLSGGNIRNNHIKLASFLHAFPQDVIGGSNKQEAAPRQLEIDWGGPSTVMSDIDGSKSIFRARGWVRRFFAASGAREGDTVIIAEIGAYRIRVHIESGRPVN